MQVILGASAVLSNGTVLSRAGSAAVAMTAHASSKPVLVCCEAFKVRRCNRIHSLPGVNDSWWRLGCVWGRVLGVKHHYSRLQCVSGCSIKQCADRLLQP